VRPWCACGSGPPDFTEYEWFLYGEGVSGGASVVGYARAGRGVSVEAQAAAIGAECERRGCTLLRVETDPAGGGEAGRPGLARLLAACRAGEAGAVVVSRLDRLARSVGAAGRLLERARREGWNLVALDVGLDLSTSEGQRVANQFLFVAGWERRMSSERTREALARTREQGVKLGTPRRTPEATVAKIKRLRGQGMTLRAGR